MKLENRFTVPVPRDEAWKVLLDVERIAPCMPGAKLLTRDGDSFTGQVKVKLGPINLTYGGNAKFVQLDEPGGIAVIDASGKETRGTGTAKATITCRLIDKGANTDIEVDTDLAITGKPAQFGRGVLADVSAKLVDQFAACLAEEIQEGTPTGEAAAKDPATGLSAGPPPTSGVDIAVAETVAQAAPAAAQLAPPAPLRLLPPRAQLRLLPPPPQLPLLPPPPQLPLLRRRRGRPASRPRRSTCSTRRVSRSPSACCRCWPCWPSSC